MMPSGISSLCAGIILRLQVVVPIDVALDFSSPCRKPQVLGPPAPGTGCVLEPGPHCPHEVRSREGWIPNEKLGCWPRREKSPGKVENETQTRSFSFPLRTWKSPAGECIHQLPNLNLPQGFTSEPSFSPGRQMLFFGISARPRTEVLALVPQPQTPQPHSMLCFLLLSAAALDSHL